MTKCRSEALASLTTAESVNNMHCHYTFTLRSSPPTVSLNSAAGIQQAGAPASQVSTTWKPACEDGDLPLPQRCGPAHEELQPPKKGCWRASFTRGQRAGHDCVTRSQLATSLL